MDHGPYTSRKVLSDVSGFLAAHNWLMLLPAVPSEISAQPQQTQMNHKPLEPRIPSVPVCAQAQLMPRHSSSPTAFPQSRTPFRESNPPTNRGEIASSPTGERRVGNGRAVQWSPRRRTRPGEDLHIGPRPLAHAS